MNGREWAAGFTEAVSRERDRAAQQTEADERAERAARDRVATIENAFLRVGDAVRALMAEAAPFIGIPIAHVQNDNGSFSLTLGNVAGTCSLAHSEGRLDLRLWSITRRPHLLIEALARSEADVLDPETSGYPADESGGENTPEAHALRDEWMRVRTVGADQLAWLADGRIISGEELVKSIVDRVAAYYLKRNFAFGGKAGWTRADALTLAHDGQLREKIVAGASP